MKRRTFDPNEPKTKVTKESFKEALEIFRFVQPYTLELVIGLILLFLGSGVFMVFPWLIGKMIDVAQDDAAIPYSLPTIGLVLIGLLVMQGFFSYFRVVLFAKASEYGMADVRKALYLKLITLPVVFFEKSRVGEIVSRLTADVEKLQNAFSFVLAEFIRQIIVLVIGLGFIFVTTPKLALIMFLTFPIIVVGTMIFGRYIRKLSNKRQTEMAETNIILTETMQSISAVKSFTNELFESARYNKSIDNVVKISMKFAHGRAGFSSFIVSVLFGGLLFIIWQGIVMVQMEKDQPGTGITAGELVAFVSYTAFIGAAIGGLGNFYTQILSAIGATERVREILKSESEVSEQEINDRANLNLVGEVEFKNVHFRYPTRDDVQVLRGIDLKIPAGKKVALVGPSGAGKSTIMQILLRFYNLESGEVTVDGENINDYSISGYRNNIAVVPQEVLLFGGTIRENILYGRPDATDEEIIVAAKQSNSWEFISLFPEGLETIVGERGVKLSGGQRQRIAIARAVLKNPKILLLDEATSSLDAESEKVVQEALNKLMENRTSIIIAHRLSTIREVDCIYVLDHGKIVEQGTHDELFDDENGTYHGLAKLQFETA